MTAAALLLAAMLLSLALAAFCAGMETGFLTVNRGRVLHLAREGGSSSAILQKALSDMSSTLTSLLVGNNLSAVAFSSSSAALAARLSADGSAERAAWTLASAFAMLYLGEFVPKLFFASRPLARLVRCAGAYRAFSAAMLPLTRAAAWFTGLFVSRQDPKYKVTTGDLVRILQDRKDGVRLTDFESALISRVLVMRRKGESITVEGLLRALDEGD